MNLVYPMFAMVVLTICVLMVMFRSRVMAIMSKKISLSYFKNFESENTLPNSIVAPARNFSNLFEAPVLFYAGCLAAMILGKQGPLVVGIAWGYVVMRVLHSAIHLTKNDVMWRMRAYAASWLFLVALWVAILI